MRREYLGQSDKAPSKDLGREECRKGMCCVRRACDCPEYVCSKIAEHVSEDVHHDDACCSEFDVESSLQTDQQGHRHGQYSQQELVLKSGGSAPQCDEGMKEGKYVDYPRCLYVMKSTHVNKSVRS